MKEEHPSVKSHHQSPSESQHTNKIENRVIMDQKQEEGLIMSPVLKNIGNRVIEADAEDSGREKLKRHRVSVAGNVWIPEIWGHEDLLKDWIDCSNFDAPLVPSRIIMARTALIQEGRNRRTSCGGLRIDNRC